MQALLGYSSIDLEKVAVTLKSGDGFLSCTVHSHTTQVLITPPTIATQRKRHVLPRMLSFASLQTTLHIIASCVPVS